MSFRYYGNKKSLATWITDMLPRHVCYVEPYGGSAAVLLRRTPPAPREVYNDLDDEVVTFFRILRERPAALVAQVTLTPYARVEAEKTAAELVPPDHPDRDLEVARRFVIRAGQTHAGASRSDVHWAGQKDRQHGGYLAREWEHLPAKLLEMAARLKHVQIEHAEALDVIHRYDSAQTCFYLDPPYPGKRAGTYRHAMTPADHVKLAATLREVHGMVVISGCPGLYSELYPDWQQVCTEVETRHHTTVTECVWLSPKAQTRGAQPRLCWVETPLVELTDAL